MSSKVAIIEPVGGHGGMDYYDYGLCGGLATAGYDVVLHTCDESVVPLNVGFEVRHTFVGIYGEAPSWKRGLRYIRDIFLAIWSAVREKRKICHFHFFHIGPLQVMNVLLAKLFARRIVITAHDVESFVARLEVPGMSRWVYHKADYVIAHNNISKHELLERIGLLPQKIEVIPHGNYLHAIRSLPRQDEARNSLGVPLKSKVILFFGQIKEVKGLDLLIDAMQEVLETHPDAILLIAGRPWKSDFSIYQAQIDKLDINKYCISHIRFIHDEDVPLYYAAADVVALPYRRIYQSGVVLMAMSYAKAVLVSDLPGMTEIVTDGNNGFVFKTGDKNDLVRQMKKALENETMRNNLAKNGFEFVRKYYNWDHIGIKTGRLYEKLFD